MCFNGNKPKGKDFTGLYLPMYVEWHSQEKIKKKKYRKNMYWMYTWYICKRMIDNLKVVKILQNMQF